MIMIDGSEGEGGGQILRTCMAMSILTGKNVTISNIRAKRPRPGLAPQHLAGIGLAYEIGLCRTSAIEGKTLGSTELMYQPGLFEDRDKGAVSYDADPKTAGSITLMIQVALPILLLRNILKISKESLPCYSLRLRGGTNVSFSPPIEHVKFVLVPILRRMTGASGLSLDIDRYGYFPRGGGEVQLNITPATSIQAFNHERRGEQCRGSCEVVVIFNSQSLASVCSYAFDKMEQMCKYFFRDNEDVKEVTVIRVAGEQAAPLESGSIKRDSSGYKKKKRGQRSRGGGAKEVCSISIIASYTNGAELYHHLDEVSVCEDLWAAHDLSTPCPPTRLKRFLEEVLLMMDSEADLDERTADQIVLYEAVALLHKAASSKGEGPYESSFTVCPESEVSSAHLQTVAEVSSIFTGVTIAINKEEKGRRRVNFHLEA